MTRWERDKEDLWKRMLSEETVGLSLLVGLEGRNRYLQRPKPFVCQRYFLDVLV